MAGSQESYQCWEFPYCNMEEGKLWKFFSIHTFDKCNIFFPNYADNMCKVSQEHKNNFISIFLQLFRLNLPLPYEAYSKNDFFGRYREQSLQILEYLPYFVFSCLFRVSCLAFMWIYLAFYATIPILVLLLVNILIFYILESDKGKFIDMRFLISLFLLHT